MSFHWHVGGGGIVLYIIKIYEVVVSLMGTLSSYLSVIVWTASVINIYEVVMSLNGDFVVIFVSYGLSSVGHQDI